jgi:hypothetical protein
MSRDLEAKQQLVYFCLLPRDVRWRAQLQQVVLHLSWTWRTHLLDWRRASLGRPSACACRTGVLCFHPLVHLVSVPMVHSFLALARGSGLRKLGDPPASHTCSPLSVVLERGQPNGSLPI